MLPDDQTATVAAAWSLSVDRADRARPQGLARPMLQLISMLDPSGVPAQVLTSEPALAYLAAQRARRAAGSTPGVVMQDEATRAMRVLHLLNLIDHSPATPNRIVRIDQLIQRAIREGLSPEEHEETATAVADAVSNAWPEIENDADLVQALRANADALRRVARMPSGIPASIGCSSARAAAWAPEGNSRRPWLTSSAWPRPRGYGWARTIPARWPRGTSTPTGAGRQATTPVRSRNLS